MIFHASILALSALGAAAALKGSRKKQPAAVELPSLPGTGLPPLSPLDMRAILHDAEQAAIRAGLGETRQTPNPHPPRTRAHILWETHFNSILMDWTEP